MEEEKGRHRCSVFLTFMILSTITLRSSHAADTLSAGQSIRDGQTLISAAQTFELGFFSPPNSSNRYVGIWYHKLSPRTIIWVGNRERPIPNISGFLTIDAQGTLMILDKIGTSIMIASNTGSTNLTSATLLDSGNLVLKQWNSSQDEQPLWQSFDHPTDTFIPGMKLGLDGKRNRLLTSWRSSDDPGPGDFSAGIDPNGTRQFFLWYKGEVQWQSGVWNGTSFALVSRMTSGRYNSTYTPHWIDGYYYYTVGDSSVITRGVMEVSGQFKQFIWLESEEEWVVLWVQPKELPCEVPATCGANGICSASHDNSTTCRCMYGFVPASYQRWRSNDWSEGCMRRTPTTECERDGFFRSTSVKLPIFSSRERNSSLSLEDCKSSCGRDCSCTAYAAAYANGTGCLFWSGELLGLQDGTQDLYVRLAASDLSQDSGEKETSQLLSSRSPPSASFVLSSDTIKPGENNKGSDTSSFSFKSVSAATDHFSDSNKLGEGGFGRVYRGLLEGQQVAVKRLARTSGQGIEEFQNEITLIANLQHKNVVRLLGYCIEKEENILIYEYMPNKSLDYYIFDRIRRSELSWAKRVVIIEGIAQGLLYLHKFSRFRVIHRDLKTSNILLDSEMNPKISDFGLARIFGQNEDQANTKRVVGTYGYMPPEYAMNGIFSTKFDIFSFGVIVLEIVSGRRTARFFDSESSSNLLRYSWELWREGKSLDLLDSSLDSPESGEEISRCINIALLCAQENAADRPTMSAVVSMLTSGAASLPAPRPPAFFLVAVPKKGLSSSLEGASTENDATVTALH
ncbi:S-locus lectin protein kinase family protein [Musa troglodytarum]|uniref:Receptor-like serine/threonine-protein kinase n=1 Tax=Musa troglodytarum TaxID=320322 RepID=A0A9E7GBM2_9LILI|nr:S-locus lectin protein kinase family protein [Musa troglodytarum]